MDRPTFDGDIVVADGLPLQRLYARFDAIARGRAFGIGSAAHQSVIARLAFNQKGAESLGWSEFVLERTRSTGRLELRGAPDRARIVSSFLTPFRTMSPSLSPLHRIRAALPGTLTAALETDWQWCRGAHACVGSTTEGVRHDRLSEERDA